jgi:hypothetical protein
MEVLPQGMQYAETDAAARCREMTEACNALEQELKHSEREFAVLVTSELEQRFARFEDVTLAAVSKLGSGLSPAPSAGSTSGAINAAQPACGSQTLSAPSALTARSFLSVTPVPAFSTAHGSGGGDLKASLVCDIRGTCGT